MMYLKLNLFSVYLIYLNSFGVYALTLRKDTSIYNSPIIYTTESRSLSGKWCLNDCVDGECAVDINIIEQCHRTEIPAPTYYTTGLLHTDQHKCTSRCQILKGDNLNRCFVDNDWNKIDYCNPDISKKEAIDLYVRSDEAEPCADECQPLSEDASIGNCVDITGVLRSCPIESTHNYIKTIKGYKCAGECLRHEETSYSWCYYNSTSWDYCAISATSNENAICRDCDTPLRKKRQANPNESVGYYASRMEMDRKNTNAANNDPNNPIYQYTYATVTKPSGETVKLPLVVRATIRKTHVKAPNTRKSSSISSNAKKNCRLMGMARNDEVGHLIAYKLGGPSEFYNFVPMTKLINTGSRFPVEAPSVWANTERTIEHFLSTQNGKTTVVVVLKYNFNDPAYPYRPVHIGYSQVDQDSNGAIVNNIPNHWYNNHPDTFDSDDFSGH